MIFVGLGSNLPVSDQLQGVHVLQQALREIENRGLRIVSVSKFYRSEPVPVSDQDWYVNAAAQIKTNLSPESVLEILHAIEADFGRVRTVRNAARTLDLDLLSFGTEIRDEQGPAPHLPHPRMHLRAFVLLPIRDLAPQWCHPVTDASLSTLIDQLPTGQRIEPLEVDDL